MLASALLLPLLIPQVSKQPQGAQASESHLVALVPHLPGKGQSMRWSPSAAKLNLVLDAEQARGELLLGPAPQSAWSLALAKTGPSKHYNQLWIDRNRDQIQDDNEWLSCEPKEQRSKVWSSFSSVLQLPTGQTGITRAYALNLWFVQDPLEPEAALVLRWSRSGWHQGQLQLGAQRLHVLLCDSQLDGLFNDYDAWHLANTDENLARQAKSRSTGQHAWLGQQAYRLLNLDPHGLWMRIESYDPGISRAEEELKADVYRVDRLAKRAPAPLVFGHDFEQALAAAKANQVALFVDFETTWCGPCKLMDKWVYAAEDVVNAAAKHHTISVKVDGDERRDLKERYKIEVYPSMLLIAPDGRLLRRMLGYKSVAELSAFLAPGLSEL